MITIPESMLAIFEKAGREKKYAKDQIIYSQEEVADLIYVIKKGRVRVFEIGKNGKEMNFDVLEKGRIFGESALSSGAFRPVTACTITECTLLMASIDELEPYLKKYNELCILLLRMLSETNDHLSSLLKVQNEYNRYQKVAYFLLQMTKNDNVQKDIIDHTIPYTNQQIADCLQLSRVTVSKVLSQMKKDGYIRSKYKHIQVIDPIGIKNKYLCKEN